MNTFTYRINNHDLADPIRRFDPGVAEGDVARLEDEGYLVRERLFSGARLEELRRAADEVAAEAGGERATGTMGEFGGLFVRHLVTRHPAFWALAQDPLLLGPARRMLGPQVQLHASVLRVTYPGQPGQETHWHFHQRVAPDPIPPFFAHPRVLDNLIYLDDADLASGPFAVVPRTHQNLTQELPKGIKTSLPGEIVLPVPAGSCVSADAALWHRGMPNTPEGHVRRLLIVGYSPTWMKPVDPLPTPFRDLFREGTQEERELVGVAGYY